MSRRLAAHPLPSHLHPPPRRLALGPRHYPSSASEPRAAGKGGGGGGGGFLWEGVVIRSLEPLKEEDVAFTVEFTSGKTERQQ